jgi:hypothetical protein
MYSRPDCINAFSVNFLDIYGLETNYVGAHVDVETANMQKKFLDLPQYDDRQYVDPRYIDRR